MSQLGNLQRGTDLPKENKNSGRLDTRDVISQKAEIVHVVSPHTSSIIAPSDPPVPKMTSWSEMSLRKAGLTFMATKYDDDVRLLCFPSNLRQPLHLQGLNFLEHHSTRYTVI